MNSQLLIEKIEASEEFEKFMRENPKAYLCSGFFVIDLENDKGSQYHFDFYVPESKATFNFELEHEEGVKLVPLERNDEKVLEKVLMRDEFDFDKILEMISTEMELKKIKNKIEKMIFSLQNLEKRDVLLGTIFLSGLGMIKANIDIKDKRITDFEKKSLFDMMKIIKK